MKKEFANFHVAFKIILRKENKVLFLRMAEKNYYNKFDFPGGRADKGEEDYPISKILEREVKEEIGDKVKYKVGKLAFQNKRYNPIKNIRTLVNIYEGEYVSGDIELSSEHLNYAWIDPSEHDFKKDDFFSEEEYIAFKEYFNFK